MQSLRLHLPAVTQGRQQRAAALQRTLHKAQSLHKTLWSKTERTDYVGLVFFFLFVLNTAPHQPQTTSSPGYRVQVLIPHTRGGHTHGNAENLILLRSLHKPCMAFWQPHFMLCIRSFLENDFNLSFLFTETSLQWRMYIDGLITLITQSPTTDLPQVFYEGVHVFSHPIVLL